MVCPRCRTENPRQAKFCLECAAPFAARCTNCETALPAAAKFCLECAHPVGGAAAGPARFASPESYTPRHLAEKILGSKAALEGERKQVTVLFADLKGSMELLADRDPEEARRLLALRRAGGPRGSCGARLLRRPPDAGVGEAVCGAGAPCAWRERADAGRTQRGRGRRARHPQRSAHGLHGGRPDDASGRAHGAARQPGQHSRDRIDSGAGGRLRRREVARPRAGEGARRRSGGLRGDGGRPGAHPPAGGHPARADALRRPRRRAGAAPPRPAGRRKRARPSGGDRRRGGGGQVSPRLRVDPLASPARLDGTARRRATCR